MKIVVENYAFDASAQTIEFTDYFSSGIDLERVLLVVNATDNLIMYNLADPSLGVSSVASNVLTLGYDTTAMDDADKLLIFYDDPDASMNVVLNSRIAGEDIINDWIKMIIDSDPTRINTATTTVIKSGVGRVIAMCLMTPVASASMTIYNNTAGSGTVIGVCTLPGTLLSSGPSNIFIGGGKFTIGLTLVTVGTAEWLIWAK